MDAKAVLRTAQLLGGARIKSHQVGSIPPDETPETVEEGYRVQKALHDFLHDSGQGKLVGWKIGATSQAMRDYLGVNTPAYGRVMSSNLFESGVTLSATEFCNLGIECEIAFRIGKNFDGNGYTRNTVSNLIETFIPAIEIVENRYDDFLKVGTPTLIADDFFHKACVLGSEISDWQSLDLAALVGTVWLNGKQISEGRGSEIMGDPLEAVAWLANTLNKHNHCLEAGQIIMTGSITPVAWLDHLHRRVGVEFDGIGDVTLELN